MTCVKASGARPSFWNCYVLVYTWRRQCFCRHNSHTPAARIRISKSHSASRTPELWSARKMRHLPNTFQRVAWILLIIISNKPRCVVLWDAPVEIKKNWLVLNAAVGAALHLQKFMLRHSAIGASKMILLHSARMPVAEDFPLSSNREI